jgi:hypothetical protein
MTNSLSPRALDPRRDLPGMLSTCPSAIWVPANWGAMIERLLSMRLEHMEHTFHLRLHPNPLHLNL